MRDGRAGAVLILWRSRDFLRGGKLVDVALPLVWLGCAWLGGKEGGRRRSLPGHGRAQKRDWGKVKEEEKVRTCYGGSNSPSIRPMGREAQTCSCSCPSRQARQGQARPGKAGPEHECGRGIRTPSGVAKCYIM